MKASRGRISQAGELRSARVESLRALAALGVMFGHVYGTAHGYGPIVTSTLPRRILFGGGFGVFVFFALSGYLLFWPFVRRDYGGGERINLRRYALNRALRILPLYYAVIVILLLVQEHGGSSMQWARFMTWTETFSSRTVSTVDGVVWSLIVELHFYVLLPLLALALRRFARGSPRRAALALVSLGAASYLVWELVTAWQPNPVWRYSLPANFYFFVPGMLVALIRVSWEERTPRRLRGVIARADAWLFASALLWLVVFWRYNLTLVAAAASFLVVGACVLPLRQGSLVRALEWRPLAVLGIASYSLYLWHIPVIRLIAGSSVPAYGYAGLVIRVVPLACVVALVSYAIIEAPFLRLRRRWSPATPPTSLGPASAVAEPPPGTEATVQSERRPDNPGVHSRRMRVVAKRLHPRRLRITLGAARCVEERSKFIVNELRDTRTVERYRLRGSGLLAEVRHPLLDTWVLEEVFRFRVYEPPIQVRRALRALERAPRILDLGGHAGFFGLYVWGLFENAVVTSFEPDPDNVSVLRDCIALNGLEDSWRVIEACAAASDGTVEFVSSFHLSRMGPQAGDALSSLHRGISHVFPFLEGTGLVEQRARSVPCRDVFPFLADADLVKMDIEGAEWEILADERFGDIGANAVVLEYHPAYFCGSDPEGTVTEALQRAGLAISDLRRTPDGGTVWAWRPEGASS